MPHPYPESLDRAAALCGIQPEFGDIFGNHHVTSPETKRAIVTALGFHTDTPEHLDRSIAAYESAAHCCFLPSTLVLSVNAQPFQIPLQLPATHSSGSATLTIQLEDSSAETHHISLSSSQTLPAPARSSPRLP